MGLTDSADSSSSLPVFTSENLGVKLSNPFRAVQSKAQRTGFLGKNNAIVNLFRFFISNRVCSI